MKGNVFYIGRPRRIDGGGGKAVVKARRGASWFDREDRASHDRVCPALPGRENTSANHAVDTKPRRISSLLDAGSIAYFPRRATAFLIERMAERKGVDVRYLNTKRITRPIALAHLSVAKVASLSLRFRSLP